MKRLFVIPFVSALVGGGVVVAVVAAAGDLGSGNTKTVVTTVESARPAAPSNASQRSSGMTPHEAYVRDAPGVAFVTSTVVQKSESSPFNLFGEQTQRQGTDTGSGIVIDAR